jgi:nitroreductase
MRQRGRQGGARLKRLGQNPQILADTVDGLGALVHVSWERSDQAEIDLEEHAAASAAVQNLLLAAHADGWAGFWSTNPALGHPLTCAWCGYTQPQFGFLGAIWLGKASHNPPPPPRAELATRTTWLS